MSSAARVLEPIDAAAARLAQLLALPVSTEAPTEQDEQIFEEIEAAYRAGGRRYSAAEIRRDLERHPRRGE